MTLKNQLLELLPPADRKRIIQDSVVTSLRLKKRLCRHNERMDAVYFPLDCVVSVVVGVGDGEAVEMATMGNEGMVGVLPTLHADRAIGDCVVQVGGKPGG